MSHFRRIIQLVIQFHKRFRNICKRRINCATAFTDKLNARLNDEVKGDLNFTAKCVVHHLLGYSCNLYTTFEDQLKTLNAFEIWNNLHLARFIDKPEVRRWHCAAPASVIKISYS